MLIIGETVRYMGIICNMFSFFFCCKSKISKNNKSTREIVADIIKTLKQNKTVTLKEREMKLSASTGDD